LPVNSLSANISGLSRGVLSCRMLARDGLLKATSPVLEASFLSRLIVLARHSNRVPQRTHSKSLCLNSTRELPSRHLHDHPGNFVALDMKRTRAQSHMRIGARLAACA
jgi:hypothetical protein